jgi:hypothetical protein
MRPVGQLLGCNNARGNIPTHNKRSKRTTLKATTCNNLLARILSNTLAISTLRLRLRLAGGSHVLHYAPCRLLLSNSNIPAVHKCRLSTSIHRSLHHMPSRAAATKIHPRELHTWCSPQTHKSQCNPGAGTLHCDKHKAASQSTARQSLITKTNPTDGSRVSLGGLGG